MERQTDYRCSCGRGFDTQQFSIQCDNCKEWFHGSCVRVEEHEADELDVFHCSACRALVGPSVSKAVTNNHRHNRTESNANNKPTQSGTNRFIDALKAMAFTDAKANDSVLKKMRGQQLSFISLLKNGFDIPVLVESSEGLEIVVPSREAFGFASVLRYLADDYELDVIDVKRQLNVKMKAKHFVRAFDTRVAERQDVYNCISLEVSQTALSAEVRAPAIVNKLSWVDNYWPEVDVKPAVSKYCLLSMQDSFTDFHIDFGGTSVWYHVLKGEKVFYLVKPTPQNLEVYEKWTSSRNSSEQFFGDLVDDCYKLNLTAGQTLFIPTAWIHAVLTPQDSIVFGGNFLHSLNIRLQLQIHEMEQRIKTPDKFKFPFFELTHWYAAPNVYKLLNDNVKQRFPPKQLVNGVKALIPMLRTWLQQSRCVQNEYLQSCALAPKGFNCLKLIKDLNNTLKQAERKLDGLPAVKKRGKSYKSFDLETGDNQTDLNIVQTMSPSKNTKKSSNKQLKNSENDKESHTMSGSDKSLIADDSQQNSAKRLRTSSTESETKASLKMKVSLCGSTGMPEVHVTEPSKDLNNSNISNRSSEASIMETINSIAQLPSEAYDSSRVDISSMISELTGKTANKLNKKRKQAKEMEASIDEETERMIRGRPQDEHFIYTDLETPGDEDAKNKVKVNEKDESWTPKARVIIKATPKAARQPRDNARRDVVDITLANAAAKIKDKPKPKRSHAKKKSIDKPLTMASSDDSESIKQIANKETKLNANQSSETIAVNPSIATNAVLTATVTKPLSATTHLKKAKKGLATPKQRIAKKLKMNKLQNFSI